MCRSGFRWGLGVGVVLLDEGGRVELSAFWGCETAAAGGGEVGGAGPLESRVRVLQVFG
jgi:hypothetical protein